jgi:hypothetical protein
MSKLTKQEVNAIANKLQRALQDKANAQRKEAMNNYTPSPDYANLSTLLNRRDEIAKEYKELGEQLEECNVTIKSLIDEKYNFYYYLYDNAREVLERALGEECKLSEIPSIEELRDSVTIAAIDEDFDVISFIDKELAKY